MVFANRKCWVVGVDDVKLTGVDGDCAPLKLENENYLDYQGYQEEVHPNQEEQTIQQPVKV